MALTLIYLAASRLDETHRVRVVVDDAVAGGCLFWGDIARHADDLVPRPPPGSLGRTLVADSFVSYETHQCVSRFGRLDKPPGWLAADVDRARERIRSRDRIAPSLAPSTPIVR